MRLPLALAAALVATPAVAAEPVTAELKNGAGEAIGKVTLTAAPKGVLLRVEAKGLTPGWHGLHFHEKADCSKSDFTSAGGHTHGGGDRQHGLLNPKANETGDLPNLYVGADGTGATEAFSSLTTLDALKDADGSAVLIHAAPDDHTSQPIGGAGARVACAAVK
ncbi:superoxide dismutase family protein [Phenylobacterium kunshanense]|uniref:Superoxide dismutase [Cu-Zn] n=1 Tax=Phenylobacterium kunshanense TaxID=1445034 RepID=A0A328B8M2_9CAUL|nr:superoxide dismutase family protein [Phenylobacterium kunshanense]RAK63702.1 superoxide dismutase family protein [Phenylobacterium kunshanense]